jgi:hypothetical protein
MKVCNCMLASEICLVLFLSCTRLHYKVSTRILQDRARLHQFCIELGNELDVTFCSPSSRQVIYYGGKLVDGAVKEYKKDLLMDATNISSSGDLGPLLKLAREAVEEQKSIIGPAADATVAVAVAGQTTVSEKDGAVIGQAPITVAEDTDAANDAFLTMVQQSHG